MRSPTVSVIVPAFNPGERLRTALEGVTSQTYSDWECVVIDDGSAENLSWVAGVDARVRLQRQPNAGVSVARNRGLRATSGPLVAYLDQDDVWEPAKLETQVQVLEDNPRVGLCDTNMLVVGAEGHVLARGYNPHFGDYLGLLHGGAICLSTVVARRGAVEDAGGFDPRLRVNQDFDLYLKVGTAGWRFHRCQQVLARYHLHDSNVSADYLTGWREFDAIIRIHLARARRTGDVRELAALRAARRSARSMLGRQAVDRARYSLRDGERTATAAHLARASALSPAAVMAALGGRLARGGGKGTNR